MMILLTAFFWELVQNLPVVMAFVVTVWWWSQEKRGRAVLACTAGGVAGALIIRYTETLKIGRPFMEAWSVTLVNAVGFSLFTFLLALYTGSETHWSSWKMDVLLGVLLGGGFALAQGLAAPDAPLVGIVLHSVALAVAAAAVLVMIRRAKGRTFTGALMQGALATLVMTAIITVIDYGYLVF